MWQHAGGCVWGCACWGLHLGCVCSGSSPSASQPVLSPSLPPLPPLPPPPLFTRGPYAGGVYSTPRLTHRLQYAGDEYVHTCVRAHVSISHVQLSLCHICHMSSESMSHLPHAPHACVLQGLRGTCLCALVGASPIRLLGPHHASRHPRVRVRIRREGGGGRREKEKGGGRKRECMYTQTHYTNRKCVNTQIHRARRGHAVQARRARSNSHRLIAFVKGSVLCVTRTHSIV